MAKSKKMTLAEFKAWIEGIEEMQSNDWHPDKAQWKKIRARISSLEEKVVVQAPQQPAHRPAARPVLNEDLAGPIPVAPTTGSALDAVRAPLTKSGIEKMQTVQPGTDGPVVKTKTPDIDTSDGTYSSPFV